MVVTLNENTFNYKMNNNEVFPYSRYYPFNYGMTTAPRIDKDNNTVSIFLEGLVYDSLENTYHVD
jgi:hypothetical protein